MDRERGVGREAVAWLRVLTAGIVTLYLALFLAFLYRVGPRDQDQFLVFHELQLWNQTFFGLAKQWSPVLCGGLSLAGEPQVPFLSLSMVLAYMFGPQWGIKLATLLYFVEGWVGAYLYAGLWLRDKDQQALAASLFVGNGFFVCRMAYGHIDFIPFLILPLALWIVHGSRFRRPSHFALAMLLLGAMFALAIDGSPVAIIHLLFWIGLYAAVLSLCTRRFEPIVLFIGAAASAVVLDAGYLWPMLKAQTLFPRRTPDTFTSVLSLIWFALIPMRGKVLPANGNGHELSVFVGPVLLWLLWRSRAWLRTSLPHDLQVPLTVVSVASIVLGMGSLKNLHIPTFLSPFDLLRPLPGFRSIGVTGRYWGFLALPLSLCGAAVLWKFCEESQDQRKVRALLAAAIAFQLGFQSQTVIVQWFASRHYQSAESLGHRFVPNGQFEYVTRGDRLQGEFVAPMRGVTDCYDLDDFTRADMATGRALIRGVRIDGKPSTVAISGSRAAFRTWDDLSVVVPQAATIAGDRVQVILHQAYHPYWRAPGCQVNRTVRGNLVLDCPTARLARGPVTLTFADELSRVAAGISRRAWLVWSLLLGAILLQHLARLRFGKNLIAASTPRQ